MITAAEISTRRFRFLFSAMLLLDRGGYCVPRAGVEPAALMLQARASPDFRGEGKTPPGLRGVFGRAVFQPSVAAICSAAACVVPGGGGKPFAVRYATSCGSIAGGVGAPAFCQAAGA